MAQIERASKEELQEDKFIEFVMEAYDFLRKHAKVLIMIGIAIIIALAAVSLYLYQQEQSEQAAALKMGEALAALTEGESTWLDAEKHSESQTKLEEARDGFQQVFTNHGSSAYADKALFYHGRTLVYLEQYDAAIQSFRDLVANHPSSLFALYGQLAIGHTYEQKGDDASLKLALDELAPTKFTRFAQLPLQEREQVLMTALMDRGRYYEKFGQYSDAISSYEQVTVTFQTNLQNLITQRSREAIDILTAIMDPIQEDLTGVDAQVREEMAKAEAQDSQGQHFDALASYLRAVHLYRILKENQRSLETERRQQIVKVEKRLQPFVDGIGDAKEREQEQRLSSALYSYEQALGALTFAPNRTVYEKAQAQIVRLNARVSGSPSTVSQPSQDDVQPEALN